MSSTHECPFHFTWCPRLPEDCPSPTPPPAATPSPRPSPSLARFAFARITTPLLLPPSPLLSAEREISLLPLPFLLGSQEKEREGEVEPTLFSRPSSAAASTSSPHPSLPSASRSVPPPSTDSTRSSSISSSHSRISTPTITVQDVLASEDYLSLYTNEEPTSPTPFLDDTNDATTTPSPSYPSDSLLFMDPSVFLCPPREASPPPPTFNFELDASNTYDPQPPPYFETPAYLNVNIHLVPTAPVPEPRPEVGTGTSQSVGGEMLGEETAFISKLWHLINHPEYSRYVRWSTDGKGIAFVESELEEFASRVLPRFFRSSKIESLIRQVNLYSFSRAIVQFQTPDKLDPSLLVSVSVSGYKHPDFQRDHPCKLKLLHPKVAARKATSRAGIAKKKAARKAREEALKRAAGAPIKKSNTPR